MSGVYAIRNLLNGRRYIGSAVNLGERETKHWSDLRLGRHHASHLQHAWNKYGPGAFVFEVLLRCESSMCLYFEQRAMDRMRPEYNSRLIARSNQGLIYGPSWREHISAGLKGKPKSEECKRKLSLLRKSAEHKRKLSLAHKGMKATDEARAKMSLAHSGVPKSAEHRAAISAALKGKAFTAAHCAALSAAAKGRQR